MSQVESSQAREILDERARRLARSVRLEEKADEGVEMVVFRLSDERYSIESEVVKEIIQFSDSTPVPGTPSALFGVASLRGQVLPIFDLREVLGLPRRTISDLFRIIVLGRDRAEFGILSDEVLEVTVIPVEEVRESEAAGGGSLVRGVGADALVVLDGEALLSDARFFLNGR